jgi:hypothetical protein
MIYSPICSLQSARIGFGQCGLYILVWSVFGERIGKNWALKMASTAEKVISIFGREKIDLKKLNIAFSEINAGSSKLCLFCFQHSEP